MKLYQVKQSVRWASCIRTEEQIGNLKPDFANMAMNLRPRDLLKQWEIQISNPPISETNNKIKNASEKNSKSIIKNSHTDQLGYILAGYRSSSSFKHPTIKKVN